MNTHIFSHNQSEFAKLSLDPSQLTGRGGALAPSLYLSGNLEISPLAQLQGSTRGVLVQGLSGTVVVDLAGGFQLHVIPQPIQRTVLAGSTPHHIELTLPITRHQLEAVESARDHGDVSLSFHLRLTIVVLASIDRNGPSGYQSLTVVVDSGTAQVSFNLKIPQSTWAKQVLNGTGFGRILLFELPAFPVSALATLGEAFEAAKRAQAMFDAGEYDMSIVLCRTAVQPLRNHLKKIKDSAGGDTSADWAEKIGTATFDWLTTVTGKTHGVASAAAHEGSRGRFDRLDAQMILTTTVSLLAYAARLEKLNSPPP